MIHVGWWDLLQKEIEKVKKRREEREIERAQQEEELSMLARERAIAEGYEMEKKEEEVRNLATGSCRAPCLSRKGIIVRKSV